MAIDEAAITPDAIRLPVSRMLGVPVAALLEWTASPRTGGLGPTTLGIARITGVALAEDVSGDGDDRRMPFSLIWKAQAEKSSGSDPGGYVYWKREALAYSSGLLESLPDGMRAPYCYGVDEVSETSNWLWLEDLGDRLDQRWSEADYLRAARLFGRLNGTPLPRRFEPSSGWLVRDDARQWLRTMDPLLARLDVAREDPVIGPLWSDDSVNAMLEIRRSAPRLLSILDPLPLALSHGDAHSKNCVLPDTDSREDAIVIDWADLGLRPAGADLNRLLQIGSIGDHLDAGALAELAEFIFPAYLEGLSEAGWSGDPESVRRAFAALYALRSGCFPIEVILTDPQTRSRAELVFGAGFADRLREFEQVRLYALSLIRDLPDMPTP